MTTQRKKKEYKEEKTPRVTFSKKAFIASCPLLNIAPSWKHQVILIDCILVKGHKIQSFILDIYQYKLKMSRAGCGRQVGLMPIFVRCPF